MVYEEANVVFRKSVMEDCQPSAIIAALCAWGKTDQDMAGLTMWDELPFLDLSADYAAIEGWFSTALAKFTKKKKLDILEIRLAEDPEAFEVVGHPHVSGQAGIDDFMEKYKQQEGWIDDVDWDHETDLIYAVTRELPGQFWKDMHDMVDGRKKDKTRMSLDAAWGLWGAFCRHAVARTLRSDKIDYVALLGKRKQVPMLIGSGDEEAYMGILTPEGWKPDHR